MSTSFYFAQFLFLILSYLISSIPFGLIISKHFAQKDIREFGSGNIGATNVSRILGKKFGLATLILDGLKGAIMVIIGRFVFQNAPNLNFFLALIGAASVLGHIFSIYINFKGGKGVATTFAVLLAINLHIGLICCIAWAVIFAFTKTSAIASLASIAIATLYAICTGALAGEIALCIFLTALIFFRHKDNISRLKNGKENKF